MSGVLVSGSGVPGGGATLNPFVVLEDASGFVDFATAVFSTEEHTEARTEMPDGRLIHAEVHFGGSVLMLCDRLDGWPVSPGLLQVWVQDVAEVLDRGAGLGATTITEPTPFYGETTLGRMQDPWGNLWWLYAPAPGQDDPTPAWAGGSDTVFRTVDEAMRARAAGE